MPAIVTHYQFGEDALEAHPAACGDDRDACDAFLLGNQGPDPLYFVPGPEPFGTASLARKMHAEQPAELLAAMKQALGALTESERAIGSAYAHGFVCHYLLDSTVHPLVYATVNAVCDAGIEGLTHDDKSSVHNVIEREWDELVMTVKLNTTVTHFRPSIALRASERVLNVVQKLYAFSALGVYGRIIDTDAFSRAVAAYRIEQRLLHSPLGIKRAALSKLEQLILPRPRLSVMSHRPVRVESTWLANHDNDAWQHPFTGETHTHGFWDLYQQALDRVQDALRAFDADTFDTEAARSITRDINFRGEPVVATLTVHGA